MNNKQIGNAFQQLAALMEYHGDNPFKVKTYSNAYITLRKLDTPLADLKDVELAAIKGIGASLASGIRELINTGKLTAYEILAAKTPEGVIEMLRLSGYGAKKIRQLTDELEVETLGELYYACEENRLVKLKGWGEKTQADIQQKIIYLQNAKGKRLYPNALAIANEVVQTLQYAFPDSKTEVTGELRRACPVVARVELLSTVNHDDLLAIATITILSQNDNQYLISINEQSNIYVYLCDNDNWGNKLFLTTGTRPFLDAFLAQGKAQKYQNMATETAVFAAAQLPYIVPERRDSSDASFVFENPVLVAQSDLKGLLHIHTTYSDGLHTLTEMAYRAAELGYEYIGITDHSKAAFYANGLDGTRLRQQWEEIDNLNAQLTNIRILKGIECDILSDGRLDYSDDVLAEFDFVIASVHSGLRMDKTKATERVLRALDNKYVRILGHPTGRLLLARPGYELDTPAVIAACAERGIAIELNANPNRLDLDYTHIPAAMQAGVRIAINPDAHSKNGISDTQYGILAARKGGLTPAACLNVLSCEKFLALKVR